MRTPTPEERGEAERRRDREAYLRHDLSMREERLKDAEARSIPPGLLAELERDEAVMRQCYRERKYPHEDTFSWNVGDLAQWGLLSLELQPAPSKETRGIAERAVTLDRNLQLWSAACHFQGIRARDDETCENEVRAVLRQLYGDGGDTVANLATALRVVGTFGGPSAEGSPLDAIAASIGQPRKATTRKTLGRELRRRLALSASDTTRKELEGCISKLADDEQRFARLVYRPGGSWKAGQRAWSSGRQMAQLRKSTVAKLIACLPQLSRFAE